jgi:[ribosomal protein S5]-alanine N-acetyltransferase
MGCPSSSDAMETARLALRPFVPEDAEAVTALLNDAEVSATLAAIPFPYYREYADAWIATHERLLSERREVHLAIVLRASGELMGAVALLSRDPAAPSELGYWLGRRYWGCGYATEAVAAIVRYGHDELGARAITARCMITNPASAAVLTKVGLRRLGRSAQPITKGDRTHDVDDYRLDVGGDG